MNKQLMRAQADEIDRLRKVAADIEQQRAALAGDLKLLNRQYADLRLELQAEQNARKNTERRLEALLDKHIGLR